MTIRKQSKEIQSHFSSPTISKKKKKIMFLLITQELQTRGVECMIFPYSASGTHAMY